MTLIGVLKIRKHMDTLFWGHKKISTILRFKPRPKILLSFFTQRNKYKHVKRALFDSFESCSEFNYEVELQDTYYTVNECLKK